MVLDPVTAIGLTCNVAQLVELSWKICSKSRVIYKDGMLPEHRDTETVTTDLKNINNRLLAFLDSREHDAFSDEDKDLWKLCQSSNAIAEELLRQLDRIQISEGGARWKSLRQALKSVWLKGELDHTSARLQDFRIQLNTRLLVSMNERLDSMRKDGSHRFDDLDEATRKIVAILSENRVHFNSTQEIHTDYLTRLMISQHEKTRELILEAAASSTSGSSAPHSSPGNERASGAVSAAPLPLLEAVEQDDFQRVRYALRDPSAIFAFNSSGQTALHLAAVKGNSDLVAYLLRNGAKVNPDDDELRTPLHEAVRSENAASVRSLLDRGADVHAKDLHGRRPRDYAENSLLLKWLLDYGSNVESKNREGFTALYQFSMTGHVPAIQFLLDAGADTETEGRWRRTPLLEASDNGHVEIVRLLLAKGADVNKVSDRQETALLMAADRGRGYTKIAEILVENGAMTDVRSRHNQTALTQCCEHQFEEIACMLLENGASFENNDDGGYAPLHRAAMCGLLLVVRGLLDHGANLNALNTKNNWSALSEASAHGHLDIVKLLLDRRPLTETRSFGPAPEGATPLIWAAKGNWTSILCMLLDIGRADIEGKDQEGRTALYHAVCHGHVGVTEALLARGADTEVADRLRYTSLCKASQLGYHAVVRQLLQAGARVQASNTTYWTPLAEASFHGHAKISELLLRAGASIESADRWRYTPLCRAAQKGHLTIVSLLIEMGADVEATNEGGWSALHEASCHGFPRVVDTLLTHGAEANRRDKAGGYSPLHRACQNGHLEIVKNLLEVGHANPNERTDAGWTPLAEASFHGHPIVVELLLTNGAAVEIANAQNETPMDLAFKKKRMEVVRKLLDYSENQPGDTA